MQQSGATARSNAQIAAQLSSPERMAFNAALEQTKDPIKAIQLLQETKREPVSIERLRADWLNPEKRQLIEQDFPNVKTFQDYVTVMGGGAQNAASGFKVIGVR